LRNFAQIANFPLMGILPNDRTGWRNNQMVKF